MPAQTTNLFLLEGLEDVGRTRELAESDLEAVTDKLLIDLVTVLPTTSMAPASWCPSGLSQSDGDLRRHRQRRRRATPVMACLGPRTSWP
jgi:hypothetical protein